MNESWEIKDLGSVCHVQRGLTYSGKDTVDISDQVVLRATNIDLGTGKLIFDELKYLREDLEIKPIYSLKKNSLLICFSSGSKSHLGKIALVDDDYPNFYFGGFIGQINPSDKIDSKYLFYCLSSEAYKDYISNLTDGVNINNLKATDLKAFQIPLPPLPEQQRIVSILDETFAAIAKAKANAEQNLQNAKELFESYLQGIVSNGDQWEKKTLAQIANTFGRGKSKHRPRNWEGLYGGDYPFIQTGDIRNSKHYITEYSQTYNEVGLAQSKLWPAGTICITIAANIAETGVLTFDACFPDSVIGIEVNEEFADREFVEYLLQSFKVRIQALGKGSAQANINLGTFENELFPFPPVGEQKAIVDKLNQLFNECERLENVFLRKIDDLEELKKSILQKAFAGELETEKTVAV